MEEMLRLITQDSLQVDMGCPFLLNHERALSSKTVLYSSFLFNRNIARTIIPYQSLLSKSILITISHCHIPFILNYYHQLLSICVALTPTFTFQSQDSRHSHNVLLQPCPTPRPRLSMLPKCPVPANSNGIRPITHQVAHH
jgi:hypothetical protein